MHFSTVNSRCSGAAVAVHTGAHLSFARVSTPGLEQGTECLQDMVEYEENPIPDEMRHCPQGARTRPVCTHDFVLKPCMKHARNMLP